MMTAQPVVVTGQQIGAGWSPALSVVKALQALAIAKQVNGQAIYWLADEDHDRLEVASVVGGQGPRLHRHRFRFEAPIGTATGWLAWTETHQREAENLWGVLPQPHRPTLRSHVTTLGEPLWRRGLQPFSPTDPERRDGVQSVLESWRKLYLEALLHQQAEALQEQGEPLPLDPREQAAWFKLDPRTGLRVRLEAGEACPPGQWLSPGAALRPLLQSLMLPVTDVVLGPAERAYWRLTEPLWERVGLVAPRIHARVSAYVMPSGLNLAPSQLDALRNGFWEAFLGTWPSLPSQQLGNSLPLAEWGPSLGLRYQQELTRLRHRLLRLDRRLLRDHVAEVLGRDPEQVRQHLFPFGRPQERVIPGLTWLRDEALLDRLLEGLGSPQNLLLLASTGGAL